MLKLIPTDKTRKTPLLICKTRTYLKQWRRRVAAGLTRMRR